MFRSAKLLIKKTDSSVQAKEKLKKKIVIKAEDRTFKIQKKETPFSIKKSKPYIMESSFESQRLALKVKPRLFIRKYLKAYINPHDKILDVGCGPGVITSALGEMYPLAEVKGLDSNASRIEETKLSISLNNVSFHQGDAYSLPFESDSFDFVYCRFLLEYLKNPNKAIKEMIRVVRPNGKILLQDLDGQLLLQHPNDRGLFAKVKLIFKHLKATGFDPYIGRKLYSLMYKNSLKKIRVKTESYNLVAGQISPFDLILWKLKLKGISPMVTKILGEVQAQKVIEAFLNYLKRKDTLSYSVLFTVVGTVTPKN